MKARAMCATCHDVSNPALANLARADARPGDGGAPLPSELGPAAGWFHLERTWSEFRLSVFGVGEGAFGEGAFAPDRFPTSRPGNRIATCQDCHMPDAAGPAASQQDAVDRPEESVEHPKSGQPVHDLTGGNILVPTLLASAVHGSPNHDPFNEALLDQGPARLTLDLTLGVPLDPVALLAGAERARANLLRAARFDAGLYDPATGRLTFKIRNRTGHKLLSGFTEGRRMFVNVQVWRGEALVREINPYDADAGTLRGLGVPGSPALAEHERYVDALVYEAHTGSTLTGEEQTFHLALATHRTKDNRIPPRGFRIEEAAARLSEPVWHGEPAPDLYTAAEYAGGYDAIALSLPAGASRVRLRLLYQTTTREYVAFLRDQLNGAGTTLGSPSPTGGAVAYRAPIDPAFDALRAWGDTIWSLWEHNKHVDGAAPFTMLSWEWRR